MSLLCSNSQILCLQTTLKAVSYPWGNGLWAVGCSLRIDMSLRGTGSTVLNLYIKPETVIFRE